MRGTGSRVDGVDAAADHLSHAIALEPRFWPALVEKARLWAAVGDWEQVRVVGERDRKGGGGEGGEKQREEQREKDRETERQRDRETERQRDSTSLHTASEAVRNQAAGSHNSYLFVATGSPHPRIAHRVLDSPCRTCLPGFSPLFP